VRPEHPRTTSQRPPSGPAAVTILALLLAHAPAVAAPVAGFHEEFVGGGLGGFTSGSLLWNPGTGGRGGDGDGFLGIAIPGPLPGNLGAFAATPDFAGDWTAAGITHVRLWLRDVGAPDALEIHVALGNAISENFWQYNVGFIPPTDHWAPFDVDLSQAGDFTFIGVVPGTFGDALATVDRLLIRHDHAPYSKAPDTVIGDVGLDGVLLTNGVAGVAPAGVPSGGPVRLGPPAPNPSRGPVWLRLQTGDAGAVAVQVMDAQGRVIRHATLPAGIAGARTWTWDGADDRGSPTAPGWYRVRAVGSGGGTSQPLLRLP
jgi:hypothetical protein